MFFPFLNSSLFDTGEGDLALDVSFPDGIKIEGEHQYLEADLEIRVATTDKNATLPEIMVSVFSTDNPTIVKSWFGQVPSLDRFGRRLIPLNLDYKTRCCSLKMFNSPFLSRSGLNYRHPTKSKTCYQGKLILTVGVPRQRWLIRAVELGKRGFFDYL